MNEALEEFMATLRLNQTDANAELNLGKVLVNLGRYDEATAHFSEALRLDPDLQEARDSIAAIQAQHR